MWSEHSLEMLKPGAGGQVELGSWSVEGCRIIDWDDVKWMLLSFKAGLFLASAVKLLQLEPWVSQFNGERTCVVRSIACCSC
jgi:hypothetical protein